MLFESRVFKLAKDPEHPEEDQDAYRIDARRGIAAIADGVTSGIFSGRWAEILTEAAVDEPPNPGDKRAFAQWLAARRESWHQKIDTSDLAWFQRAKLRQGAFSTLLWIELNQIEKTKEQSIGSCRLRATAVGDSCLFHVRDGRILQNFPIETAAEFESDPVVIGSIDLKRDELLEFKSLEIRCRPGDLLVLCTDAVAAWALEQHEQGQPPAWDDYWQMSPETWEQEIRALRHERHMRYDDATLVLLRFAEQPADTQPAEAEPAAAQPAGDAEESPIVAEVVEEHRPPPPHGGLIQEEWIEKFKVFSKQFEDQFSEQVARGLDKIKEVAESAEDTVRKYRDKHQSDDKRK